MNPPVIIPSNFFNTIVAKTPFNTVGQLISVVLPNVLVIAGVIFFILLLGSGIAMVFSAGGESSPQSAAKAKAAVTYSLIGFLLVISAYFILQIISTITGVNFFNPII